MHCQHLLYPWNKTGTILASILCLSCINGSITAQKNTRAYCDSSTVLNNKGADYIIEGDWEKARNTLKEALDYTLKCNSSDSFELIPAIMNLGIISVRNWQYETAIDYFRRAEVLYESSGKINMEYLSFIYTNFGRVYSALGDYNKAETYFSSALLLYKEIKSYSEINKASVIYLYNSLGLLKRRMKRYDKAIEHYLKAVDYSLKLDQSNLAYVYGNIALAYRDSKQYQKSEEYFIRALETREPVHRDDSAFYLVILNDYAGLLLNEKKHEPARHAIDRAMKMTLDIWGYKNPQRSEVLISLGRYYECTFDYDGAIAAYLESIAALFPDDYLYKPDELNIPDNVASKQHLLVSMKALAHVYHLKYHSTGSVSWLRKSLISYEQAINLVEKIRQGYLDHESRLFIAENEKATLNAAIMVALDLYNITSKEEFHYKAFTFSEKSKAALLLSSIQGNQAIHLGGIPSHLYEQEKDLLRNISRLEESIYEQQQNAETNNTKLLRWKNDLYILKREYEQLIHQLEVNYPRYYQFKYKGFDLSEEALRGELKRNGNLVEYNLTDTSIAVFTVNRKGIHSIVLPIDSAFSASFSFIIRQLQEFNPNQQSAGDFRLFCRHASKLYDCLFRPVEKYLISNQVIIVPDEYLSYLPFEILLTDSATGVESGYRKLSYLINKYTLSYSYSAALMVNKQLIAEKKSNRHILAIAPVYDNPPPPGSGVRLRQRYRDNLYPLPGALEEARQINRLLKGTLLTDTLATEEAFIKIAPDYGILHLAMHTLIDNRNPLYSKLIFTRTGSEANDGLLNTYELYNLNLNARMVVLSACRSGDGILSKGEGIMSLTRGFLYAGCPSVIMTLWNVEDKTGLNIMIQFYRQLCKGKTKNDALRSAKLDYLKEAAPHKIHPYYWAGYLQIGDETAVFVPLRYGLLAAGPAIVLAWIVFWLFRRRKGHGINLPADNERPDQI